MGIIKGILFLLLLAAAIGFAVQNDETLSLRWYFDLESHPLPVFLWAFLFFLMGLVLSSALTFFHRIALQARIHRLKKTVADLERKCRENNPPPLLLKDAEGS